MARVQFIEVCWCYSSEGLPSTLTYCCQPVRWSVIKDAVSGCSYISRSTGEHKKHMTLSVLTCFSRCDRALRFRKLMPSSPLMFGWYANGSSSRKVVKRILLPTGELSKKPVKGLQVRRPLAGKQAGEPKEPLKQVAAEAQPQETTVAMELRTTAAQVKGTNAAQQEQGIAPA